MLLPAILAEIERARHARLVDDIVDQVENIILETDVQINGLDGSRGDEAEKRAKRKRSVYLDIAYLRNGLVSWNSQLTRMLQHCRNLSQEYSGLHINPQVPQRPWQRCKEFESKETLEEYYYCETNDLISAEMRDYWHRKEPISEWTTHKSSASLMSRDVLRNVGEKIEGGIISLRDEYDDKIRDCTMRVDGMTMATQWVMRISNYCGQD